MGKVKVEYCGFESCTSNVHTKLIRVLPLGGLKTLNKN